ncbi:MAG: nucleotidyl transferase AbiEii/AbiGii toxin family protein [Terrimicrobiaceae bacterium]
MKPPHVYATAAAFRIALESRLKSLAQAEGVDLQRLRRQVSFDRLLARLFSEPNAPWLRKGGYAMELRLRSARTTKDIDLSLPGEVGRGTGVLERLQDRAAMNMGDYFTFAVGLPQMDLEGAPEGGSRYPVIASLAGRVFTKFHLDVGIGDAIVRPTEIIRGRDWLEFAGIPLVPCIAISREQQFAEKLHAYTRPRERSNSRVKDLLDMTLLVKMGTLESTKLKEAIRATFDKRGSHAAPTAFPDPPDSWHLPYAHLAAECGLEWTIEESVRFVASWLARI